MHHLARASLLIGVLLPNVSCSDIDARLSTTQPSVIGTSLVSVSATSSTAFAQPVTNPVCPSIPPFSVSLGVIVRASGPSDVTITGIRMQFTDTSGRRAPQVTLPQPPVTLVAPGPTIQFGNALTLPFGLGIGCVTDTRGTVVIIVESSDNQGRHASQQVSVTVR